MEKMMLAIGKFKEGEGHFEKFMQFFQSDEGMEMRKTVAHVEKLFQVYFLIKVELCLRFMCITNKV